MDLEDQKKVLKEHFLAIRKLVFDHLVKIYYRVCPLHHFVCFYWSDLQQQLVVVVFCLLEDRAEAEKVLEKVVVAVQSRRVHCLASLHLEHKALFLMNYLDILW